jgi:AcrR family transcriptional regulator
MTTLATTLTRAPRGRTTPDSTRPDRPDRLRSGAVREADRSASGTVAADRVETVRGRTGHAPADRTQAPRAPQLARPVSAAAPRTTPARGTTGSDAGRVPAPAGALPAEVGDDERIIAAAWRVLARSGFRSLKVRQVLLASGVSANVFYRHFPGKSHLLLALMTDEWGRAAVRLRRVLSEVDDPERQLRLWIWHNLAIAYEEQQAARARMFMDPELIRDFPREVEQAYDLLSGPLVDVIERGAQQGLFPSVRPWAGARAVYHLCAGVVSDRLAGLHEIPQEEAVELVTDFALRALTADRSATSAPSAGPAASDG